MDQAQLSILMIILYSVGMIVCGWVSSRGVTNIRQYYIGDRNLSFWIIGLSIICTNIGADDYLGAMGAAYRDGLVQANFEWLGAIPAMILAVFVFIPAYWKAGVYTIPEFVGLKYGRRIRRFAAIVLCAYALFLSGIMLWATGIFFETIIDFPVWVSIIMFAVIVGLYSIRGGMSSIIYTDVIQFLIMFAGSVALLYFGLKEIGGPSELLAGLYENFSGHMSLFNTEAGSSWDGWKVILGLGFVLSPAYWCTNQIVLQRTFAAKNVYHASSSMMLALFIKMLIPLVTVVPALILLVITNGELERPDDALPYLITHYTPVYSTAFFVMVFLAALQSSIDSVLNVISTYITNDILDSSKGTDASKVGQARSFVALALLASVLIALFLEWGKWSEGAYGIMQMGLAVFQGSMLVLVVSALMNLGNHNFVARIGFVGGIVISSLFGLCTWMSVTMRVDFFLVALVGALASSLINIVGYLFITRRQEVAR